MAIEENPNLSKGSQNRGLQVNLPTSYATYVDRWAIVVGVSKYQDGSINLKYADRDAEALYELLKTPSGGGFAEEHICKLVNEDATTANITRALRSFLKRPGKEDIVLLYFACHGAPDTDRPDILYLLTHDTDPKDIAGTALPMREINLSLKENLLAERVIIIADTCHSAGISKGGARDAGDNSGAINLYLQEVGAAQKGIALLTSAEANQVSFEDEQWGGGHGVFTHFLLEGMKGAADCKPKNGIVTVGELFEYVRENVKRATGDRQHPCIGPDSFDRNLPIAITAGISAQEQYELGCQLYQIALKLDDKYCFESASRHLREAIRQAEIVGRKLPEAHLQLGLALTASGNLPEAAVTAFRNAIKAGVPDADYYLGIAYLNQGKVEMSRQHLEAFVSKQPDSDKTGSLQELISWFDDSGLSNPEAINRYALLIGINYSETIGVLQLKGCVNDIEILNEVLSQKYKFKVKMLPDMEATYENIAVAFRNLQEQTRSRDVVIIYYSGHQGGGNWVTADTKSEDADERLNFVNIDELYDLIDAIPAFHKHLIMDSDVGLEFEAFNKRVEQTKLCTLFFGALPGQGVIEVAAEDTKKPHGYFTYTLVQELWQASEDILQRDVFERVKEKVESKASGRQTPFFLGDLDKPLFFAQCPDLFTFSHRRCYSAFDDLSLQALQQKVEKEFTTVFPDFYYSLGLAFLEKGDDAQALALLKTAVERSRWKIEEKLVDLGLSQFKNQLYSDAAQTFKRRLELTEGMANGLLNDVILEINNLAKSKRFALLIGIDTYSNSELIAPLKDAVSDTLALREALISKVGFQPENVKMLLNQEATYQNILKEFVEIVNLAEINPSFFYFAGIGSVDGEENPTILAFDSRYQGTPDIPLKQLSQITNQTEVSLISVIDSSWTNGAIDDDGRVMLDHIKNRRYVQCDQISSVSCRKLVLNEKGSKIDRSNSQIPQIGYISIYPESIRYCNKNSLSENLTTPLISFLEANSPVTCTYQQLLKCLSDANKFLASTDTFNVQGKICLISKTDSLNQTIFGNDFLSSKVRNCFIKIEQEPTRHAVLVLQRLIEQRNGAAPEELFNLGIAYYRLNEYKKSVVALQTTIDQISGQDSTATEGRSTSQRSYPEAHYWLGRVLYESKLDPARAVSELRLATQQSPDNIAAHYYLGKALQALVEQEILTEAERAFQTYLNAGAPLGQQEEVQEFFKSRRETEKN